ncbi:MAG: prepilin-type N-terminal cleavage/methylation domain-containing protein [Kiritimatiellae bacterium]|nr:prepilin-type N-terminal cleavage/methylation domain-containing protein [Kiritimatiellia bacterium]MDD5522855.1 prepilin-type N-terminal cleavage/methylation domain-containing protein [Kiritimatiellia bacterium]
MNRSILKSGFTLTEVMIASLILLIVSFGIMGGIIAALKVQANAADYYRATCIARNRIQHAKVLAFASMTNGLSEAIVQVNQDGDKDPPPLDFWRATSVSDVVANSVMLVTVDVWYSVKPGVKSASPVTIQTMIEKHMLLQ